MTPSAWRQAGEAHIADADADQAGDGMTKRGHHPAHLPVAALVNRQLELRLPGAAFVLLASQQPDILGRLRHTVVQHDSAPQTLQGIFAGNAGNRDPVGFRDMVALVRHLKQKVAIIGQKDQAFAVGVQTPDRAQHRLAADVH